MTEKRFKHSEIIQDDGQTICYGIEDTQTKHIFNVIGDGIYDVSEKELIKLLNELHEENQHYKHILQDLGLLMSDEEVRDIRTEIADKLIKPLFEEKGFNVDVDTTDGFTIVQKKGDYE